MKYQEKKYKYYLWLKKKFCDTNFLTFVQITRCWFQEKKSQYIRSFLFLKIVSIYYEGFKIPQN